LFFGDAGRILPTRQNTLISILTSLLALHTFYGFAHQFSNDGAFVLTFKSNVEGVFDVFRHAEIHGGHGESLIVENFNKIMSLVVGSVKTDMPMIAIDPFDRHLHWLTALP